MKVLRTACLALGLLGSTAIGAQTPLTCTDVDNCSFEMGTTDWLITDMTDPFFAIQIAPAGTSSGFGFFSSAPVDGSFSLVHGFDGGGPDTIEVEQDVSLPAGSVELGFYYRAAWDMVLTSTATANRTFEVRVEPAGGGAPLQTDLILSATPLTIQLDTGGMIGAVDLTSFAGSTVRINFVWTIPEDFTGPGFFELDAITLTSTSPGFRRGDVNNDGGFNLADVIALLGILFPSGPAPVPDCADTMDGNDDGSANLADAIAMLGELFPSGGPAPLPAPGSAMCGPDPTMDSLDCSSYDSANCP